jgi:hypothetical protein
MKKMFISTSDWAILSSLSKGGPASGGGPNRSEADMPHRTNSGHHGAYDAEAAGFWIFAAVIVVIAFRDVLPLLAVALTLLALAFAIATAAWWVSRNATTASVTHLRPALTGQREPKRAPARSSRRGTRAA